MKRRPIAFDLDNTLAESKSPVTNQMADLLNGLLKTFQVCVISGGEFEQFEEQLLSRLKTAPRALTGAPVARKRAWDSDGAKKRRLRDYVAKAM